MVLMPEPLGSALDSVGASTIRTIFPTPSGKQLTRSMLRELLNERELVLICGRYEGIDQRIIELYVDDEISIGDYVISSGELAALVIVDALFRHIEGVINTLDHVNTMEAELIEAQKRLYGLNLEVNNYESQIHMQQERIEDLNRQISHQDETEAELKKAVSALDSQQSDRRSNLEDVSRHLKETESNILAFEENLSNAESRIEQNRETIESHERQRDRLREEIEELRDELRGLYDDIVSQLDSRLKETGYSLQKKQKAQNTVETAIRSLEIHLDGRLKILHDAHQVGDNREGRERVIDAALEGLQDASERIRKIRELFATYTKSVPDFIDEFLSPKGIITRKREIDANINRIRSTIVEEQKKADELRQENHRLSAKGEEFKKTLEELRMNNVRMQTQRSSLQESLTLLERQRGELNRQIDEARRQSDAAEVKMSSIKAEIGEIKKRRIEVENERTALSSSLTQIEEGITKKNHRLRIKENQLKTLGERLDQVQGQVETLQVSLSELKTEVRNLYENFMDRYSRDLREYHEQMSDIQKPALEFRTELAALKEKLRSFGQVNLMAPEEFVEVKERFEFLTKQMEDLQKARGDLNRVTEQIRKESSELFTKTYELIKRNFHVIFRRLFGGGRAELALSDPDNLLSSGVEIYAQPPGKKLESIDLLSGGERSLTAVAILFATYMVKPSPFCILDEIDAALDEENVGRFVSLLREFSQSSQFVIVTHNKRTVVNAETLLGVTMEESGVSKVISVRLGAREEVPA